MVLCRIKEVDLNTSRNSIGKLIDPPVLMIT